MRKRAQAGHRWLDHAIAQNKSERLKMTWDSHPEILNDLVNPPPLAIDVEGIELPKTKTDILCFKQAGYAANRVLRRYGLAAMRFSPDYCHILPDTPEMRARLNGSHGAAEAGRVYVIKQSTPELTLFIATHEMTHLSSLTVTSIITELSSKNKLEVIDVFTERSGVSFHFRHNCEEQFQNRFIALNETITEMLAKEARKTIPKNGPLAKLINLDEVLKRESGLPAWALVTSICIKMQPFGISRKTVRRMLVNDYLYGGHRFIQTLYRHWPQAAQELSRTGRDPAEIARTAKRLGFENVSDLIAMQFGLKDL